MSNTLPLALIRPWNRFQPFIHFANFLPICPLCCMLVPFKGSRIVLANGKKWNVERLAKVQNSKVTSSLEHTKIDSESDLTFMDINVESKLELARPNVQEVGRAPVAQDPVRRSARERQPPPRLNDYVR